MHHSTHTPHLTLLSSVDKDHSSIYCFKKDYKKVENSTLNYHARGYFDHWAGRPMGSVQDHPKSYSTRSTQNSDFYTIGQIFCFSINIYHRLKTLRKRDQIRP